MNTEREEKKPETPRRHRWRKFEPHRRHGKKMCRDCGLVVDVRVSSRPKVWGNRPLDTYYFRGKEYLGKNLYLPPCLGCVGP